MSEHKRLGGFDATLTGGVLPMLGLGLVAGGVFLAIEWLAGWQAAIVALIGLVALGGAFLSLEFGVGLLLALVILFGRGILFTVEVPFLGGGLKPTDLILVSVMAGWLTRSSVSRKAARRLPPAAATLLLVFVGWAVVSAFLGMARGNYYKDSLLELRPLLVWLLFIPIVKELSVASVRRLFWLVVVVAVLAGIRAIVLYVLGRGAPASYTGGGVRIMSVGFAYLLFALLLCLSAFMANAGQRARSAILGLIALGGLVVTFQRTAALALAVAIPTVLWLAGIFERRRILGYGALCLAVGGAVYTLTATAGSSIPNPITALAGRLESIGRFHQDVSAIHRLREWHAVAGQVASAPLLGNGLGTRVQFWSPMYNPVTHQNGIPEQRLLHSQQLFLDRR